MDIGKEIPDALRRAGHEPYISLFRQMQDRFG